jgi:hypothetical protein
MPCILSVMGIVIICMSNIKSTMNISHCASFLVLFIIWIHSIQCRVMVFKVINPLRSPNCSILEFSAVKHRSSLWNFLLWR